MISRKIMYLTIIILLFSCNEESINSGFNSEKFSNNYSSNILCFDLSKDQNIIGGLLLNSNDSVANSNRHYSLLPFSLEKMDRNISIYNSYVNYNNQAIIDYTLTSQTSGSIGFKPYWSNTRDNNSNLYLISSGLRRTFVYNHKISPADKKLGNNNLTIKKTGIYLPADADVFEKEKNIPFIKENSVRYYDLLDNGKIEIEYLVKPVPSQKKFSDFFLKIAGILLIPILQFLLFDKQLADEKRKKALKTFLKITIFIQVILFLIIGYFLYTGYKNGEGFDYFDLALMVILGISEFVVLWIKKGSK